MPDILSNALNNILRQIGAIENAIGDLEEEQERKLAPIRQLYEQDITTLCDQRAQLIATLETECKTHKAALFDGDSARLDLESGAIIYALAKPLIKRRDIVVILERAGLNELLRIIKEADWDKLDKLPEDKTKALGLKRKKKETISYELK